MAYVIVFLAGMLAGGLIVFEIKTQEVQRLYRELDERYRP